MLTTKNNTTMGKDCLETIAQRAMQAQPKVLSSLACHSAQVTDMGK